VPFQPFGPASPSGPAGGGLSGTYPNPGLGNGIPWQPSDLGLLLANMDTVEAVSTALLTAGTVYLARLQVRQAVTITNICAILSTAGVGASTGSFAGLYNPAGTLLSGSADVGATLTGAAGLITMPLSTPQAVAAGSFVWAALVQNLATTQATLARNTGAAVQFNAGLTAATFRWAVNGTGLSSLPGSITPASNVTAGSNVFWAGAS